MLNNCFSASRRENNKKKICGVILITLVLLVVGLFASCVFLAGPAQGQSYSIISTGWSEYVGANKAVFYGGPVIQSDFSFSSPGGFYGGFWFSEGLDNTETWSDFDDEIDLYFGWSREFDRTTFNTNVACYLIAGDVESDVAQFSLKLSRELWGERKAFPLYLKAEVYTPTGIGGPGKGFMFRVGAPFTVEMDFIRPMLSVVAEVFYDSGAFGFDEGFLASLDLSVDLELGRGVKLHLPKVKCYTPLSNMDDGREFQCIYGAGFSKSF